MADSKTPEDEAREYAESIINTVREPLIVLDNDLRAISASRSFYDAFKVKPEETEGQLIYDLGNKQWDIPELRQLLETLLPQKTTLDDYEVEHEFADLGRRTMLFNAREIPRKSGKERLILLAIEDITERKRLENLLSESEERYRRLYETANDGIVLLEKAEGKITHANPAITEMLGHSHDELIGKGLIHIGFPGDIGAIQEILQTLEKEGILHYKGAPVQTKTGQLIDTDIYMVDKTSLVQCNIRDITERKRGEEALRQSENYYRAIFENSCAAMFIIEEDTAISLTNTNFEELSGYSGQEIEGKKSWIEFAHPDEVEWLKENHYLGRQDLDVAGRQYELRFITRHGEERNLLLAVDMIPGTKRSIASCIDITERKKAEQERDRLQAQLRQSQKMEAIGTLAGGIAHDFNNILSSVLGYTELSLDEVEKGSLVHQNLSQVLAAGSRARDLIKQILAFGRKEEQEFMPTPIVPLVKEALKMLRFTFPSSIEIREIISIEQAIVYAEPTQLHQVIVNLATNAKQAMSDEGGILGVTVETVNFDENIGEKYPDTAPGNYVRISVSDTGGGISEQYLDKIFEPYFTTSETGTGTGLGLSVVHGIVKAHKGHITVYSEPGEGTTFHVHLPLAEQERSRAASAGQEGEALPAGTESVLIVDDEKPIVEMQQRILESQGYRVTPQTSSVEALEAFRANPDKFDIVITDMTMPDMTGDRLALRIKEIRPDVPVILCTGFSEKIDGQKKGEMGIEGYMLKPVTRTKMAKTVRSLLDEAKRRE